MPGIEYGIDGLEESSITSGPGTITDWDEGIPLSKDQVIALEELTAGSLLDYSIRDAGK